MAGLAAQEPRFGVVFLPLPPALPRTIPPRAVSDTSGAHLGVSAQPGVAVSPALRQGSPLHQASAALSPARSIPSPQGAMSPAREEAPSPARCVQTSGRACIVRIATSLMPAWECYVVGSRGKTQTRTPASIRIVLRNAHGLNPTMCAHIPTV